MRRADLTSISSHNELLILRLVRRDQPVSMAGLAQTSGLQASTVSRLVKRLAERGLIVTAGMAGSESSGGRPAVMWVLNGAHAASAGIYLASNVVAGILLDLNQQILASCALPFGEEARESREEISGLVRRTVETLVTPERLGGRELAGLGLTSLGFVSPQEGKVRYFDLDLDIGAIVGDAGGPLMLENDANAVARGEVDSGSLAKVDNALVLYAHEGLGAGVIVDGHLLRGYAGAAGEVAYRECSLLPSPLSQPEPEVFDKFVWATCALVNLLNPEVCLLTGDLHNLRDELMPRLEARLPHYTNPVARAVRLAAKPCDPMEVAGHMARIVLNEQVFRQGETLRFPNLPSPPPRLERPRPAKPVQRVLPSLS